MPELIVEVHIPLTPDPTVADGDYAFPWIDEVTQSLHEAVEDGDLELYDDEEEHNDNYVFFLSGADEATLLGAAGRLATMPGVPTGVFAVVTDSEAESIGEGRRVDIS